MNDKERDVVNQLTQFVVSLEGSEGGEEWFANTGVDPAILHTLCESLIPTVAARVLTSNDLHEIIHSFEALCMAAFSAGYDFAIARATGGTQDKE